jgi:nitronate monooxygenase
MTLPSILTKNLRLPVIAAPMFIASTPELVIEQCKAGIIGSLPALNARPQAKLEAWIIQINEALAAHDAAHPESPAAPFAINQISHPTNERLAQDMAVIAKHKVPIVIVSLYVSKEICDEVHSYGGIVLNDVISNRQAKKSVEAGVDGLVAVAAGAGGHTGNINPFALVSEIREWWQGPLALSGAIANGNNILAALATGADFAYIGSPFLATPEASTQAAYKQMVVDGTSQDIFTSDAFSGVPANFLIGSIINAGLDPKTLKRDDDKPVNIGESSGSHKTWKDIWGAGHGIGGIKSIQPTADLIAQWRTELATAKASFNQRLSQFGL